MDIGKPRLTTNNTARKDQKMLICVLEHGAMHLNHQLVTTVKGLESD